MESRPLYYLTLFRGLQLAGARYLVAGGVALNLHGVPRMTADLDLAVALDEKNLLAALEALESAGFVPSLPVAARELLDEATRRRWYAEKNLLAFPFHNPSRPFESVDLLVNLPLDFEACWVRRAEVAVGDAVVPLLSIDDLIALKRGTDRPQDEADADALARLRTRLRGLR